MSRFRYLGMLATPLVVAYVVAFAQTLRPSEPSSLFYIPSLATVAVAIYAPVAALHLERNVKRGGAAKLRAKGKDPERVLLQLGVLSLSAPAGLALPLWALGWLAPALVHALCAFAFLGICTWGWRYRTSIGGAA